MAGHPLTPFALISFSAPLLFDSKFLARLPALPKASHRQGEGAPGDRVSSAVAVHTPWLVGTVTGKCHTEWREPLHLASLAPRL